MARTATRLVGGVVAVVLPFAAVAACGIEKKLTIKQEFSAAKANLSKSKAVSFTFHLRDDKGSLAKLANKDGSTPKAVTDAMLHGSVTVTFDPAGIGPSTCAAAGGLKAAFNKAAFSIAVNSDHAEVAELRLVSGNLYAYVGLKEIGRIAKAAGVKDFDSTVNEGIGSPDSPFAPALADVKAGKWLELPLSQYLDQLKQLTSSVVPDYGKDACATGAKARHLGDTLLNAVKPYVKFTDANNSSTNRVLDVNVRVRPALSALLSVLRTDKSLPFGAMFMHLTPSAIADKVTDGTAHGTITLKSGHLTQVAVDIESIRLLDPSEQGKASDSVAGSWFVVDVNDHATQVAAPTNVSKVDLGKIFSQLLGMFMARSQQGAFKQTMTLSGTPG